MIGNMLFFIAGVISGGITIALCAARKVDLMQKNIMDLQERSTDVWKNKEADKCPEETEHAD